MPTRTPQSGQHHVSGTCDKGVPAGKPSRGAPVRSSLTGFLGLMNFLRFEAFYYVALFLFWLLADSTVPGLAGFLLGGVWIHDGDPGVGVALAPVGGLLLLIGVIGAVRTFGTPGKK